MRQVPWISIHPLWKGIDQRVLKEITGDTHFHLNRFKHYTLDIYHHLAPIGKFLPLEEKVQRHIKLTNRGDQSLAFTKSTRNQTLKPHTCDPEELQFLPRLPHYIMRLW